MHEFIRSDISLAQFYLKSFIEPLWEPSFSNDIRKLTFYCAWWPPMSVPQRRPNPTTTFGSSISDLSYKSRLYETLEEGQAKWFLVNKRRARRKEASTGRAAPEGASGLIMSRLLRLPVCSARPTTGLDILPGNLKLKTVIHKRRPGEPEQTKATTNHPN